jgi:hypothetical protein
MKIGRSRKRNEREEEEYVLQGIIPKNRGTLKNPENRGKDRKR